ncbi:MAG TPA: quinol oxidase [Geobacteraceae bacterium]
MGKIAVLCLFLCGFGFLAGAAWGDEKPKAEKVFTATVDSDGVQRVDMVGGKYFFDPNRVIVKVSVPVELKVRREPGMVPHNIVMDSPEAGMKFKESLSADPRVIRFTPAKTGKFPFYCDKRLWPFPSHREEGMKGVLEVVE